MIQQDAKRYLTNNFSTSLFSSNIAYVYRDIYVYQQNVCIVQAH